jgi:hypothetical protein
MITTFKNFILEKYKVGENFDNFELPTLQETYEILKSEASRQGRVWLDDEYDDSIFDNEEDAMSYVEDVFNILYSLYDKKFIPVYRVVKAIDVDLDPYGIGESWSFDLDACKQFAKMNLSGNNIKIIRGYVPRENVDWEQAIRNYYNFSDFGDSDSEFELPIPSGNAILDVDVVNFKDAVELPPY